MSRDIPDTFEAETTVSATGSSDSITVATGSFPQANGLTMEVSATCTDQQKLSSTELPNAFSLQLNTNFFKANLCPANNSACRGWQQFVFDNPGAGQSGSIWMQYWLYQYGTASQCPGGWQSDGNGNCYRNSENAVGVKAKSISDLTELTLRGGVFLAGSSSAYNEVLLSGGQICDDGGGEICSVTEEPIFPLTEVWKTAEFNIYGEGCYAVAKFSTGSLVVKTELITTGANAITYASDGGTTGESTNLIASTCCVDGKGIIFAESTNGAAKTCCPSCKVGSCGGDGCGGQCACPTAQACSSNNKCITPDCGAGYHWGEACTEEPQSAKPVCSYQCLKDPCAPKCPSGSCGSDGCGGTCPACADGVCNAGECCKPHCPTGACGADGCGGTCSHQCEDGESCHLGFCTKPTCKTGYHWGETCSQTAHDVKPVCHFGCVKNE